MTKSDPKPYCYEYPHPAVAADLCIFAIPDRKPLSVLLIERGGEPFKGRWALPGGFLKVGHETIEECAARELKEETGHAAAWLKQFGVYSEPARDPREHVLSVAFMALVGSASPLPVAGTDAAKAEWIGVDEAGERGLAFDHATILQDARRALVEHVSRSPILLRIMPEEFTLWQLQKAFQAIHGHGLDKANFRRSLNGEWLVDTGKLLRGKQRPARMFRIHPDFLVD